MLEGGSTAVMDEVAPYRKYADECRGLSATTKDPEHKKQLLEMAAAWDTVARQQKSEFARTTGE
jgi:hypothetical protein